MKFNSLSFHFRELGKFKADCHFDLANNSELDIDDDSMIIDWLSNRTCILLESKEYLTLKRR